jgi:hypothetical protein
VQNMAAKNNNNKSETGVSENHGEVENEVEEK